MNSSINNVIITELRLHKDERGWLSEIYRSDECQINSKNSFIYYKPEMSYISHTNLNQIRGPHEHKEQTDFFVFCGYGNFELYLWDNRENSESQGKSEKLVLGESHKASVLVPPGIVHGYKSISKQGSLCINLPNKLYKGHNKGSEIDEIRHELDINSMFKIK